MKKSLIALFTGLLILGLVNTAQAASLFNVKAGIDGFYNSNGTFNSTSGNLEAKVNDTISLLFDLSSNSKLMTAMNTNHEKINSMTLKLYQSKYQDSPDIQAFLSQGKNDKNVPLSSIYLGSLSSSSSNNGQWVNIDFDISKIPADTGNNYSIVVKNVLESGNSKAFFYSKEKCSNGKFTPYLEISTAPVPEPSSMVLGFIGLASALGFKRRRK